MCFRWTPAPVTALRWPSGWTRPSSPATGCSMKATATERGRLSPNPPSTRKSTSSISRPSTRRTSASSIPDLALTPTIRLACLLVLAPVLPLAAQDAPRAAEPITAGAPITAGGQVVRITANDTVPAAGADVVLHRIGRDRQGPFDSLRTDRLGRFRFTFPADTTALYLLTSRHHGVQYFSDPVHTNPERPDTGIVLAVHDTASSAPLTLEARHIVISAPEVDGSRNVVELLSLVNEGPLARIPSDSASPAWSWRIPAGAIRFAVSEGELAAGAVSRSGDSGRVHAPIPPGARELTVEYLLEI